MTPRKKQIGAGAKVTCITKFLNPGAAVQTKHDNNIPKNHITTDLVVIRQQSITITRRKQLCCVYRHPNYVKENGDPLELHSIKRFTNIIEEGDPDLFFDR
jgi:hypothetical protein